MQSSVPRSLRRFALPVAIALLPLAVFERSPAIAGPEGDVLPVQRLSTAELDELVAAIALYPDVVLDSLLPATVATADIAAAATFVASQGGTVEGEPDGSTWDPGVVALLQFPDVLRWMGENPSWVERMGFAVAMQQGDVLAAIQRYRATARAAGVLTSNSYETVVVDTSSQILIQPASANVVYVPVYDPWLLRQPYVHSAAVPFYSTWFSFSFGSIGFWSRHRIFWGAGIYGYGDPWWYGRHRTTAADWGTSRPARWTATRRVDQPWARTGWSPTVGGRTAGLRSANAGVTDRRMNVAPSVSRMSPRTNYRPGDRTTQPATPAWQRPVTPAAPITRWRRPIAPTPIPRAVTPNLLPRVVTPRPNVVDRGTVNTWRRRGNGSLGGRTDITPVAPAPLVVPVPRVAPREARPQVRMFPAPRPPASAVNGSRTRVYRQRGHRSLNGS